MFYVEQLMKIKNAILCLFFILLLVFNFVYLFSDAEEEGYRIFYHNTICISPHFSYHYKTCHDITVTIDNFIVVIPKGFDTDLASIPRFLWAIISPSRSDFIAPAILHDYLYVCNNGYNREEIDDIFYQALIDNNVVKITALEMYYAVRLFGDSHFNHNESCYGLLFKNINQHNIIK